MLPIRGNGSVEKITSTGTSKYAAIRSARYRLGLYSPASAISADQRGASSARISPARSAAASGVIAGLPTRGSQFRS